jgi:predicted enzyme related to lactoylglutathione lyase
MIENPSRLAPPRYRGLLAVVIILGLLIVLALGALVGGAIMRARAPAPGAGADAAVYATRVAAPGETLESASADGGRIVLRFASGAGGGELVVVDAATGRLMGRIAIDTGR